MSDQNDERPSLEWVRESVRHVVHTYGFMFPFNRNEWINLLSGDRGPDITKRLNHINKNLFDLLKILDSELDEESSK